MRHRITVSAKKMIVSDECRDLYGNEKAIDKALAELRAEALALIARRGDHKGDDLVLDLSIERYSNVR